MCPFCSSSAQKLELFPNTKETTFAKKRIVLKGEKGKRVASGGRHFRPTSGFAGGRKKSCELAEGGLFSSPLFFQSRDKRQ